MTTPAAPTPSATATAPVGLTAPFAADSPQPGDRAVPHTPVFAASAPATVKPPAPAWLTAPEEPDSSGSGMAAPVSRSADQATLGHAEALLARGLPAEAAAEAAPVLARRPSDTGVWLLMARVRLATGEAAGALRAAETAAGLRPGDPIVLAILSDALAAVGRTTDALATARNALAAEPGSAYWQHLVALRLADLGEGQAEAERLARTAAAAMPHEAAFRVTLTRTQTPRHRHGHTPQPADPGWAPGTPPPHHALARYGGPANPALPIAGAPPAPAPVTSGQPA